MQQLSIDAYEAAPRARRRDPITSHLAAEQAKQLRQRHHNLILAALRTHGEQGKDGIAARTSLTGVQVCRRLDELHHMGLIRLTGKTVMSTAGRAEREWAAA